MCELYKNIAQFQNSTVAMAYTPAAKNLSQYESEARMEDKLVEQLKAQGYGAPDIHTEEDLVANLRVQLERLNAYHFSDSEWKRFFEGELSKPNSNIIEKTRLLQDSDTAISAILDDGSRKNIRLLDKRDIPHNYLQVIRQYVPSGGSRSNRYDVTILVNGLPLVHIELKRRGVNVKQAFYQIDRYGRESFWAGCALFEFVQVFVISNGTYTKYYSNTTRDRAVREAGMAQGNQGRSTTSNSFEFTSYWADVSNRIIPDIEDFTATFFAPNTILNILLRYCVFTIDNTLLVLRPYQIAAAEAIIQRIRTATNYRQWGTMKGGGYIWHTTGSGKTLTSFKTARLVTQLDGIDKVLFIVDRKDLDYQTMKEYNRFEKDAVNGNKSTEALRRQLEDPAASIIVTTIQKMSVFIKKNPGHEVYRKHVVIIFDECHRSQFGDMHRAIVRNFKAYHMFGFTGTPIFPENAQSSGGVVMTTGQLFGDRLHIYTILNAIEDENVLPFKVDYVRTAKIRGDIDDEMVQAIDKGNIVMARERISNVTSYILENYARKTLQDKSYEFRKLMNISEVAGRKKAEEQKRSTHLAGFNSIFAVQSIPAAKAYYEEFARQQADLPQARRLKVGLIYSYGVNEPDESGSMTEEDSGSTSNLDKSSRDFLDAAIADYNRMFGTSYNTSDAEFENYYKDVSLRMKNRELDILIVVNMFLTGFDATTLNTLWLDKNLRQHGLIQAASRTNRILNSVKTFGNIVCFRDLSKQMDDAIALFGESESRGLVLLRTFEEYLKGYTDSRGKYHEGYIRNVAALHEKFPDAGIQVTGESNEKQFVDLFNEILKQRNILTTFDEFSKVDPFPERELQDYASTYQNLHDKYVKRHDTDKVNVVDDIVFEMELIRQVEINIDYILFLLERYRESGKADKEVVADIRRAVSASPTLRKKKDLIEAFIDCLNPSADSVVDEWLAFVAQKKKEQLDAIITEEGLNAAATRSFLEQCFRDGEVKETGTEVTDILPPMSLFSKDRSSKKARVIEKLRAFFEKFADIDGE